MSNKVYHGHGKIARGLAEFSALILAADGILALWASLAAAEGAHFPSWMAGTVWIAFAALGAAAVGGAALLTVRIARRIRTGRRLGLIDSYTICQMMAREVSGK